MTIRLNKVTRDLNVGITTVVEFLQKKGYTIEASPNAKITEEQYAVLVKEFSTDKNLKIESEKFSQERQNKECSRCQYKKCNMIIIRNELMSKDCTSTQDLTADTDTGQTKRKSKTHTESIKCRWKYRIL